MTQIEQSSFVCCFACTLRAKLPILTILIHVGLDNILGFTISPRHHRFELTFCRWINICFVSLHGASSVAIFDGFVWAVGGNIPHSFTLVASPCFGTIDITPSCLIHRSQYLIVLVAPPIDGDHGVICLCLIRHTDSA
jgi:hypothetical protein